MRKKHYGPNDLVSVESQTDASDNDLCELEYRAYVQARLEESMEAVGSMPAVKWALTHEMIDLQVLENKKSGNLWMAEDYVDGSLYVDDTLVTLPPQPQTRSKPKVYKRKNKSIIGLHLLVIFLLPVYCSRLCVYFDLILGLLLMYHISNDLIHSCWCRLLAWELDFIRNMLVLCLITALNDSALMLFCYLLMGHLCLPSAQNHVDLLTFFTLR